MTSEPRKGEKKGSWKMIAEKERMTGMATMELMMPDAIARAPSALIFLGDCGIDIVGSCDVIVERLCLLLLLLFVLLTGGVYVDSDSLLL